MQDDDFNVITIPPGAHELESLNNENGRNIIKEGYITEKTYPFINQLKFSTLGSNNEIRRNFIGSQSAFTHDDSVIDLLGLDSVVL